MIKKKRPRPPPARLPEPDEGAAAYARVETELDAIPPEQVGRVTADIPTAVSLALGAWPLMSGLIEDMKRKLKEPPLREIESLRDAALAALHAHLRWVPRSSTTHEADLEEARVLRERLLAAADVHAIYGHIDPNAIAAIREGQGHLDRANDLLALAALMRGAWPEIEARTPVSREEVERAGALGTLLVTELGSKTLGTGPASGGKTWADRRVRAFRLFINRYDEIRRAVEYLRWHEGDADAFVPSLHPKPRRTSTSVEEPAEAPATEEN
jgi:hypothetical protein